MANNTQLYRLQVQLKRIAAHREANVEAEVKAIYNSVLQELQNKIASYYAAYGDNDGILTGGELRKIGEYKNFLEDVLSGLDDLGEPVQQQIRQTIEQTYTTCYDGMVAAVQQSTAKDSDLSETLSGLEGTTPEAVRQVVENPMTNLTLSAVLNRQRSQVTTSIKKTLTTGLASGDSYTKMAQRIAKTLNGNYTKAQRIVRTECNRAIHKGFQDVTDQAASLLDGTDWVEVKTWLSKSDERVRETHAYMDGQMVHAQGEFTSRSGAKAQYPGGFGVAAEDINCRCTVKYTLMKKDEFLAQGGVIPGEENSADGLTSGGKSGIIRDERITQAVKNGDITLTLNPEKQNPHIYGSKEYDPAQNKSYFTISFDELQEIIFKYYGTGKVKFFPNGQIKEVITTNIEDFAVVISSNGNNLGSTNRFTVHYSKGRTHIVPAKKEEG